MDCRHIQFSSDKSLIYHSFDGIKVIDEIINLFKVTAFWAQDRQKEDMIIALENSNPVVTVWDHHRLIGLARATSDGVYRATIWDVIIHPDYQGLGLGRKMVETVLTHPLLSRVERVYLMTTHQQSFYKKIGFQENQTTTMILYNNTFEPSILTQQLSTLTY